MIFNSYIYLYHLDKYALLPDYPETVVDSMASTFTQTNALARTAPVFSYQNSGPRQISTVSFKLHRDMMNGINAQVSNLKEDVVDFSGDDYVDTLVKYLQAASLPKYNEYSTGSKAVIPPMVAVRLGNDIFIKGVINGAVTVTYEKPILNNDKYAVVNVSFNIFEVDPYDAVGVAEMGSFRGIARTFKDGIYNDTTASPVLSSSILNSRTTNKNLATTFKRADNNIVSKQKVQLTNTTSAHGGHGGTWGSSSSWHTSSSGTTHGGKGGSF